MVKVMVAVGVSRGPNMPDAPTMRAAPMPTNITISPMAKGSGSVIPPRDEVGVTLVLIGAPVVPVGFVMAAGGGGVPAWLAGGTGRAAPKRGRSGKSERHWRDGLAVAVAGPPRSAPHTIHLVASSPTRVPQVGHKRGGGAAEPEDCFVIVAALYQTGLSRN
jgi:hypothetical protein